MYRGRIVEQGPTDAVLQDPQHAYTRLLLSAVPNPESGLRLEPLVRGQLATTPGRASSSSRPATSSGDLHERRPDRADALLGAGGLCPDLEDTLREVAAIGDRVSRSSTCTATGPMRSRAGSTSSGSSAIARHSQLPPITATCPCSPRRPARSAGSGSS